MNDHAHLYVGTAFVAGILFTVVFKELLYPELKLRFRNYRNHADQSTHLTEPSDALVARHGPPAIVDGIEGCIGNTPLLRIKSLSEATGCEILAKAEFLNGAGQSSKDRVALSMIEIAEEERILSPRSGDTIYEGTSGSTGISLATLARAKGYLAHICMPSDQAVEKSNLLLKLGAVVDRVPPAPIVEKDNFVNRARDLAHLHTKSSTSSPLGSGFSTPNSSGGGEMRGRGFFADQFENEANWRAHFNGTGPELYAQCNAKLDAFVTGAGTGGTVSGVALFLKPRIPNLKVVLADPQGSGLYNRVRYGVMFDLKEREGTRRRRQVDSIVEGIGINRVTANFEAGKELVDDAVRVTDAQAMAMARWLVEKDGIFIGSSSAVNCFAAVKTAMNLGPGHRVVTVLSDSGSRHLSRFWARAGDVGGATDTKLEAVMNAKDNGSVSDNSGESG